MAKATRGASRNADTSKQRAVLYARVSSKEQEREGFSIPAQLKLLREYAKVNDIAVLEEHVDVESAKQSGRSNFGVMIRYLRKHPTVRILLVEKTDRLYRNLKDWVTIDELNVEIHFVKEGVILSSGSRSSEKFMHGIKVLMAKNFLAETAISASSVAVGEGMISTQKQKWLRFVNAYRTMLRAPRAQLRLALEAIRADGDYWA